MHATVSADRLAVEEVRAAAYRVPTEEPESDGTLEWDSTTMVVAEVSAGGVQGLGYSYTHAAAAELIRSELAEVVHGCNPLAIDAAWQAMQRRVRNFGRRGLAATAISAVDIALWDLKAKLLDLPLVALLGQAHSEMPLYGSGGFTSYTVETLQEQLASWAQAGLARVKMKVGRDPAADLVRVRAAREAIGANVALFVDANGAYRVAQALAQAARFAEQGVSWFEEPVSADDLIGLREVRERAPAGMAISVGEYGYELFEFRHMLEARAVDVLQADITRCLGLSGLLRVAALCEAHALSLSTHTAPAAHLHAACALLPVIHMEYFHDHVRVESMLLDGVREPVGGQLRPDLSRPGHGLTLRRAEARRFTV